MTRVQYLLPAFHVGHAGMGDAAHVVDWAANLLTQGAVDSASGAESSSAQAAVGGAGAAGAAASGLGPVAGASGVRRGAASGVGSRAVLGRCGPEGEDFKASLALPLLRCCVQVSRRAGAPQERSCIWACRRVGACVRVLRTSTCAVGVCM